MSEAFNKKDVLHKLGHYLPDQSPLKDFVHHNTLHSFQHLKFNDAVQTASKMFGYKGFFTIQEYRQLYKEHKIREDILERVIIEHKGEKNADEWIHNLFHNKYDDSHPEKIGSLRAKWKKRLKVDFDTEVHSRLFKLLSNYLDQGVSIWSFPVQGDGFLDSLRLLEKNSFLKIFRTKRSKHFLENKNTKLEDLLKVLVGDEELYEQYIFDQQFAHPGWSGMVSNIERNPQSLLDSREISLHDLVFVELILEIEILDRHFGTKWKPLATQITAPITSLFTKFKKTEEDDVLSMWQEAFEWTYYDEVLTGIHKMKGETSKKKNHTFQAFFCIDDREGPIRRHIEYIDEKCETYGTPGHFGVEFYYQPKNGKFHTKVCPGPITPKYLIKEFKDDVKVERDIHFSKKTHHPIYGFIYSISIGFYSVWQLFKNVFKPESIPAASSSFAHMGKASRLSIENKSPDAVENGLQIGFTIPEMVDRLKLVFKSTGLCEDFADLVYIIGHGGSSINNTYYAGYDCGACSGRPGSVNARVFSSMANDPRVRKELKNRGIVINDSTQFVGGLHDTTRDEFAFYDENLLSPANKKRHEKNLKIFDEALANNAKERSRRFEIMNSQQDAKKVHQLVKNRSISLFETRPELNHSTNTLCIVGRHSLNEHLFLDRRAFANSYDYRLDPTGELLLTILNAATPVCGGINLEYYFSRVDNEKLGAGSKLPHNVMSLIGVTNGVEGDLRTGLPLQMIEVHDPLRLLMIVEQYPKVVLETIKKNPATYEWYANEWINLVVINPDTYEMSRFKNGAFVSYEPLKHLLDTVYEDEMDELITSHVENLPVYLIKKHRP